MTTTILPLATLLKIVFFKSFSFVPTFLLIEAFKVSFVLGKYRYGMIFVMIFVIFIYLISGLGLINGIGFLQFSFLIEFR